MPPAILYSNAAYQWVENHIDYFPGLLKLLPSGGQLAIQMPRNHEAPSHALMRKAAEAGPWRDKLAKVGGIRSVFEPARYYDVLKPLCSDLEVWETIYQQVLTGKDPVAQYTAGTGLRPYMEALNEAEQSRLLRHLRQAAGRGLSDARRRHHAVSLPPPVHRGAPRMMLRRLLVVAGCCWRPAARRALRHRRRWWRRRNPLAVEAGLEVLRRGGSAVDAAIAVQMVLGVVEPQASGIGGGGFLLHYDAATGAIAVYDGRETAPAGATSDDVPRSRRQAARLLRAPCLGHLGRRARRRGACSSWRTRSTASLPGASCSSRRSDSARDGFAVPPRLAAWLQRMPSLGDDPGMRAVYFNADGSPKKLGEQGHQSGARRDDAA